MHGYRKYFLGALFVCAEQALNQVIMVKLTEELSAKFTSMSIVCAFFVVCMHTGGEFEHGSFGWWIIKLTRSGVCRIAVPYFFVASGFFLAGKYCKGITFDIWKKEVSKRFFTVLLPMALWPIISMVFATPFIMVANMLAMRPIFHNVPFLNGEYCPEIGIYWFLRMLFLLVLLSPLILYFVRRLSIYFIFMLFVIYWGAFSFLNPTQANSPFSWLAYSFSLEGLAYFSLGIYLRFLDRIPSFRLCLLTSVSFILMLGSMFFAYHYKIDCLDILHIPFTMCCFWQIMVMHRWPSFVISSAFPIYLMHGICIVPIRGVMNYFGLGSSISGWFIIWVGAFGTCLLITYLMRRYIPRMSSFLFGGR